MTKRLLVGNLDAELAFASASGAPPRTLPRRVLGALSGFATLLRAFARDGDELRTLLPVAPERVADVPGLPRPRLGAGPLTARDAGRPLLAWAETAAVAACRRSAPAVEVDGAAPLDELVWRLLPPAPEAAARVNHRGFCLATARELGCALPDARLVSSSAELGSGAWVVKGCFSAAGRSRFVHRAGQGLDAKARRTLARLFIHHGPLLWEPWMERTDDFGCAAVLTPETARVAGFHRQLVDRQGRFTGLELTAGAEGFAELSGEERRLLLRTLDGVARALRGAGYLGPFGVDCWRYRRRDGAIAFHPLGEINARMTFGLVGRVLVDRVREPLGLAPDARVRIVFGRSEGRAARRIPLLLPDASGVEVVLEVLD